MGHTLRISHSGFWLKRHSSANFLSEGVRCGLDKEIALDGTYLKYFPFRAMIERSQMAPYHKKLKGHIVNYTRPSG